MSEEASDHFSLELDTSGKRSSTELHQELNLNLKTRGVVPVSVGPVSVVPLSVVPLSVGPVSVVPVSMVPVSVVPLSVVPVSVVPLSVGGLRRGRGDSAS
ncbi:unnamed protein product [Lampetra planeri]